jgi:hypothetical protein
MKVDCQSHTLVAQLLRLGGPHRSIILTLLNRNLAVSPVAHRRTDWAIPPPKNKIYRPKYFEYV